MDNGQFHGEIKNNFYLPVGNSYIRNYKEESNNEEVLIDTTFKLHHIDFVFFSRHRKALPSQLFFCLA